MNKKMIRIVALVLCGVLLLGMVPLLAFAEEIQPRAIVQEREDEYYFDTFEDLKELAATVCYEYTDFIYQGDGELVITEDLVIPEEYWLRADNLRVASGVTLTATYIDCGKLVVEGQINCDTVVIEERLEVVGTLNADSVHLTGVGAKLAGAENIGPDEKTDIMVYCDVETMEQLQELLEDAASAADSRISYNHKLVLPEITESVTIPANCSFQVSSDLVIPEGVTVEVKNKLQISALVTLCGTLKAEEIELFYYADGKLEVAQGATVDFEKMVLRTEWVRAEVSEIVPGLDLSQYEITDFGSGWTLEKKTGGAGEGEQEDVFSGSCGKNASWNLEDGVLTISGTGVVSDYEFGKAPWYKYGDQIHTLVIEEGIFTLGAESFSNLMGLTDIYLPASLGYIEAYAFSYGMGDNIQRVYLADLAAWCQVEIRDSLWTNPLSYAEEVYVNGQQITELVIPEGVETINNQAFNSAHFFDSLVLPASVTCIGTNAFFAATMTKVTIHGNLDFVDGSPFYMSLVEEMYFTGDAPVYWENLFEFYNSTVKVYYPAGNDTWTEEILTSDLNIEWIPYEAETPGDMDGDGGISDADVAQLLWYTLFPETYEVSGNPDINGDNAVNDADVAYLLWHTLFPDNYPLN